MPPQAIPEMVGASDAGVTLTGSRQDSTFAVSAARGPGILAEAETAPRKTYLNIEHVTSDKGLTTYEVYVNLPDNPTASDYDDHHAGSLAMFGVPQASVPSEHHAGSGVHFSLDITDLTNRLKARNAWSEGEMKVSFLPRPQRGATIETPVAHPPIQVGRVSLYHS